MAAYITRACVGLILLGFAPASIIKLPAANHEPETLVKDSFLGDSFSFLIAGDNGGFPEPFYSTKVQREVAAAMAVQSTAHDCKYILEIGDNFYFRGVRDIFDERWQTTIPCGIGTNSIDGVPIDFAMAEEQWSWFEKELQDSQDADYLIVAGHYPIYSAAATGPTITCMKNRMDPLLQKYGVSAYISGHEHSAQHLIATDGSEVQYIIIGCSNFVNPFFANENSDEFSSKFLWASWRNGVVGCFGRVDVTTEQMDISIMEANDSQELYTITIPKRIKS